MLDPRFQLVYPGRLRRLARSEGIRVSQEFLDAFNERVVNLLNTSLFALKADSERKTLQERDIGYFG